MQRDVDTVTAHKRAETSKIVQIFQKRGLIIVEITT